jgi:1-acyl-sn-glycerol-3-phosphate acyltransferase
MADIILNPEKEEVPRFHQVLWASKLMRKYHRHEVQGLEHIPEKGRAIIVINHAMVLYDIFMLWEAIYGRTGRYTRTLIDKFFYKIPLLEQMTLKPMGMNVACWENSVKLLDNEELILLSPGGMREWRKPSTEKYQLQWEGRNGFARLAIETGSPIILAACPKADDIYQIYENPISKFLYGKFKYPFIIAKGWGLSQLPKPVKLTHHLSEPIIPPPIDPNRSLEDQVQEFQIQVTHRMQGLMELGLAS